MIREGASCLSSDGDAASDVGLVRLQHFGYGGAFCRSLSA